MDITQFKIKVENTMKVDKIKKSVKDILQKESDERQGLLYQTKQLYDPVIKKPLQDLAVSQKEIADRNQDEMIAQLKENQRAITSGFDDLIELNPDIYTKKHELPFSQEALEPAPAQPLLDISKKFTPDEFIYLIESKLPRPSLLLKATNDELKNIDTDTYKLQKKLQGKLTSQKKHKGKNSRG